MENSVNVGMDPKIPELSFWLWTKGQWRLWWKWATVILRTVSSGASAKDELHTIEAEAVNYVSSPIKVALATLKMSIQPTVSCESFEITLPVILRLKCGSALVRISAHTQ